MQLWLIDMSWKSFIHCAAASLFNLSLNSLLQCPFLFLSAITMSVKLYFGKQKSRVNRTFLALASASISEVAGQRFGGMCVVWSRCYSKEFCLCLPGEKWLAGSVQLWDDVGEQVWIHWLSLGSHRLSSDNDLASGGNGQYFWASGVASGYLDNGCLGQGFLFCALVIVNSLICDLKAETFL